MAEQETLARPYAEAVFRTGSEQQNLAQWSEQLTLVAAVLADEEVKLRIGDPGIDRKRLTEILLTVCGPQILSATENLLRLLVVNNRLDIGAELLQQFEAMRAEAEQEIEATVESAYAISKTEQNRISAALEQHFGRTVRLQSSINKDLLAGMIIRAGDWVIDGSAKARVQQLANSLAH